jgi:predicted aspartyl protease
VRMVRLFTTILILTCWCCAQDLPYKEVRRAMLVEVEVNGHRANLLVDTGADHTVLSPEIVGLSDLDLTLGKFSSNAPGLGGEAVVRAVEVKLTSEQKFRVNASVMKLEMVSQRYGVKIDGLLGQDILSRCGRVSIDYRTKTIQLGSSD